MKKPILIYLSLSILLLNALRLVASTAPWSNWFHLFMVALCNRAGHYIFAVVSFFFFLFSSLNLSGYRLDVYNTSTHGVALVRI